VESWGVGGGGEEGGDGEVVDLWAREREGNGREEEWA